MVMDQEPMEMPAPDIVGREFVRQYYTLLHDAPEHAHRFYNSNSYFVHGSMTRPAIGQVEIHEKIQQLNFRDCHAKISQVDSQVTLGNGVVVHVSGELSNDGEPMRRFSQTFVLGTQSPKKYYVHNDIFRYQDMLQSDEEGEVTPEKDEVSPDVIQETANREYYPPGPVVEPTPPPTHAPQSQVAVNAVPHAVNVNVNGTGGLIHEEPVRVPEPVPKPMEPAPVMNGGPIMANEDLNRMIPTGPGLAEPAPPPQIPRPGPGHRVVEETTSQSPDSAKPVLKDEFEEEHREKQLHISEAGEQPKTFANLFKDSAGGMTRQVRSHVGHGGPPMSSRHSNPPMSHDGEAPDSTTPIHSSGSRQSYPDSHQVFLGKLPLEVTEEELKDFFGEFGTVVELRIQQNKGGNTSKGNFGFVTFKDASSARTCLQRKPIVLSYGDNKSVELNVEEKKSQPSKGRMPQSDSGNWLGGRGPSGRGRGNVRGALRGRGSAPPSVRPSYQSSRR